MFVWKEEAWDKGKLEYLHSLQEEILVRSWKLVNEDQEEVEMFYLSEAPDMLAQ